MPQNPQLRVLTLCAGFYREVAELVAKTDDQVLAHYYQRSPANDSDPLEALLAEVSKPIPPPHNASNSSQSAARVTRRRVQSGGVVKDGKHADEVNKLPLSVVVSPGVTSADSSSNRVSAKAATHGEMSWAKAGQAHGNHSLSATLNPTEPCWNPREPSSANYPPLLPTAGRSPRVSLHCGPQAPEGSRVNRVGRKCAKHYPGFEASTGGVYQNKGVAKGYMLSSFGSERDCFLHGGEFIISHGYCLQFCEFYRHKSHWSSGGGTHTDGTVEDQKGGHPSLKDKKIYLAVLAEVHDVSGSKVVRYKFAFQCFWTGARPEGLEYISDFLQPRESPVFPSDFDARLVPEDHIPVAVAASFQLMRGWHCHRCGHIDRDQNLNVAQDTHPILGGVHTAAALQSVGPVTRRYRDRDFILAPDSGEACLGQGFELEMAELPRITKLVLKRYTHSNGWGFCQSFALPDNRGTVHHIRGSDSLNYLANHLLENYQIQAFNGSLKLRRYPLKKRTGPFFRTFSRTIYVAGSSQTIPLNDAPSAVGDAHHLIESRVAAALGQPCIFNEVLSVAYLDAQSMAFHSDNEIGLGPVVAGLSLVRAADIECRGDILAMEGAGVQEHYQHAVYTPPNKPFQEPQGFRIAVTARYIAPGKSIE
ncbi:hypothetical protein B0H14DRAFT_3740903 [Mycena olivaceomarginata]|nr:hypothetical protein B0H14DRAFT_3740903 [Mycena olivaceomarginata]